MISGSHHSRVHRSCVEPQLGVVGSHRVGTCPPHPYRYRCTGPQLVRFSSPGVFLVRRAAAHIDTDSKPSDVIFIPEFQGPPRRAAARPYLNGAARRAASEWRAAKVRYKYTSQTTKVSQSGSLCRAPSNTKQHCEELLSPCGSNCLWGIRTVELQRIQFPNVMAFPDKHLQSPTKEILIAGGESRDR